MWDQGWEHQGPPPIEDVADPVTEQIQADHRQQDRQTWERAEPPARVKKGRPSAILAWRVRRPTQ